MIEDNEDKKTNNVCDNKSNEIGDNNSIYKKTLTLWISVVCACLICVELCLNYFFNVSFEIRIIVEIISIILSVLVFLGVIKKEKSSTDITEIKKEIESDINKTISKLKNKK